jgi:hypothetical protein
MFLPEASWRWLIWQTTLRGKDTEEIDSRHNNNIPSVDVD